MKVDKVINNNLVRSQNGEGHEVLVMGCGLGFKKKPGDAIDPAKVEKIYSLQSEKQEQDMEQVLSKLPLNVLQAVNEIYETAGRALSYSMDDSVIAPLADHIHFALERHAQGMKIPNALLSEIRSFYPDEFKQGQAALQIIRAKTGVQLPEDEAGFIALHFINASTDLSDMSQTREMMDMISTILQIVKYDYKIELDQSSLHYHRFITHLKYFAKRVFAHQLSESEDTGFFQMVKSQYKRAYQCAAKVQTYIEKHWHLPVTDDEMIYLTVHINRITQNKPGAF